MCSIMGYCSPSAVYEVFMRGFQRTISRGPDASKVVDTGEGYLGFHRLAIMGMTTSGMQPFLLDDSYVVCNGEIYGFEKWKEELKEKYVFKSESDCEVLLPLYQEYGVEMFAMLDAEFACIIYDGKTREFIAARDPIGIRPLFYGYDKDHAIIFASEAKNLVGLTDKIMPFPPGYYYKNGTFICYCDIAKTENVCQDDLETVCGKIHDKLTAGVEKRLVADAKIGFLLSGGLDSSLVCAIAAKKSSRPIRTFAIGMSEDAIDLKYAKQVADYIGSDHTEIYMTPDDVIGSLDTVIHLLGTYDITTIRASIGMYFVCKAIHEQTDIRVLLTGEISDELFGYKYTDFAPDAEAFQKESQKRVRELYMYDVLRADRCISVNSLEARVPFADHRIMEYVFNVPWQMKYRNGVEKSLLRDACADLLPRELLWRKKSPYPKTYHPAYEQMLIRRMRKILNDPNSPVLPLLDRSKTEAFLAAPKELGKPWFGQLMAGPQLIAYFIQINTWMQIYHLSI